MDVDMEKTLHLLRQQNQRLLDQLKDRQTHVRSFLGTLNTSSSSSNGKPNGKEKTVAKINLVQKVSNPVAHFPASSSGRDGQDMHLSKRHLYQTVQDKQNDPNKENDSLLTLTSECPTLSSTPDKQLPHRVVTPQSILKHRKMIDDNVKVSSKFNHTPIHGLAHRNLNFSYSDANMDEIDILKKIVRDKMGEKRTDASLCSDDSRLLESITSRSDRTSTRAKSQQLSEELEDLLKRKRLLDSGNDRTNAPIVRDLSGRPKSVLFDEEAPQGREMFGRLDSQQMSQTNLTLSSSDAKFREQENRHTLLGYDFIAGLLDNESALVDKSDLFFEELNEFRRVNKSECISNIRVEDILDLARPVSPGVKDPTHTCIHGFNINDRLFAEPLNEDDEGRSVCPVCLSTRKEPTVQSPAFVRVSIPRCTLQTPYRVKPHRRRSFDESDNMALSKHCLAGWECSQPSMLPTASTVDLKQAADGLKAKLTTTIQDVEKMTQACSRVSKTQELLDTSRSLRYDMQLLEMGRGLNRRNPANTTAYPV